MNRLDKISQQVDTRAHPPVHQWKPTVLGEIDISIDLDGVWRHEGATFERESLVRLFASILWFEQGQYFLVTPAEKLRIQVADVPYIVQQLELVEANWIAITNTQEQFIVGSEHPVELRDYQGQWVPYVRVRYDLWARLSRTCYLTWVSAALEHAEPELPIQLSSGSYQFEVAR